MNIKEVAKLAKVSTATVSRTINGSEKVRPRTPERVRKAIADLKFYPNTHARTLVSGRSRLLGLIISDITNPFFPELVKSFEGEALRHGREVLIGNTDYDPKRMAACIGRMMERKVDGVAIMTSETDPLLLAELANREIPTVLMDTGKSSPLSVRVNIDHAQGIYEALDHLFALNHTRIAFISGPMSLQSPRVRHEAFVSHMKANGVAVDRTQLMTGNHRTDGGVQAMRQLLRLHKPPTATADDGKLVSRAIGSYSVSRAWSSSSGVKAPGKLSIGSPHTWWCASRRVQFKPSRKATRSNSSIHAVPAIVSFEVTLAPSEAALTKTSG